MQQHWKGVGRFGTVGLELALSILLGMFVGRWLDRKFDTGQWLTFVGFGFGLAAGVRAVLRALKEANRQAEREEEEEHRKRREFHDKHR